MKLITTLKHLSRIMGQVVAQELPLEMNSIYEGNITTDNPAIHTCGTPACVVGYAALDAELTNHLNIDILKIIENSSTPRINPSSTTEVYEKIAIRIWGAIDSLSSLGLIADSIFAADKDERWNCGEKYLKSKGLDIDNYDVQHLIVYDPTPQDAKDWIDLIISIEEQEV